MKTTLGFVILFWIAGFLFSMVGIGLFAALNNREIAFKRTTALLRQKVLNSKRQCTIHHLLLFIWFMAWFFIATGALGYIAYLVFDFELGIL